MAALADERGRQESELRQRRMKRRAVSPSDDPALDNTDTMQRNNGPLTDDPNASKTKGGDSTEGKNIGDDGDVFSSSSHGAQGSREMLEAAARASLRTKFDHVGIDPHSSPDRDVRSIAENRGMTNSPPPPSLVLSAAPSNISLQSLGGVSGFVRQHVSDQNSDHHSLARVPSPILFPPSTEATIHSATNLQPGANMHMLQLHHAVALAGVSLGRGPPSSLELMAMEDGGGVANRQHGGAADGADLDVSVETRYVSRGCHRGSWALILFTYLNRLSMVAPRLPTLTSIRNRMTFRWMILPPTEVTVLIQDQVLTMNLLQLRVPWH
jgi:hypothetical protein